MSVGYWNGLKVPAVLRVLTVSKAPNASSEQAGQNGCCFESMPPVEVLVPELAVAGVGWEPALSSVGTRIVPEPWVNGPAPLPEILNAEKQPRFFPRIFPARVLVTVLLPKIQFRTRLLQGGQQRGDKTKIFCSCSWHSPFSFLRPLYFPPRCLHTSQRLIFTCWTLRYFLKSRILL